MTSMGTTTFSAKRAEHFESEQSELQFINESIKKNKHSILKVLVGRMGARTTKVENQKIQSREAR
jgi:hypothetical protein